MTDFRKNSNKPRLQLFQDGTAGTVFNKENFITRADLKLVAPPPQVELVFNHRAMEKIRALTAACDIEIGALGIVDLVHKDANGRHIYKVYDIFVPEQECSATVTRMTTGALGDLLRELTDEWSKELGEEAGFDRAIAIKDHLFYWWHSHVNMATGPSGQDEREFTEQASGHNAFFMSIGNKRGDLHCNIKMKVENLPRNFAQWEIRDVPWSKDWETIVSIKDEVHPLLIKAGQSKYRVRMFDDRGASEILVDPDIQQWAKDQVRAKVKSGGFGKFFQSNETSTLVLPKTQLEVKEFYVEEETDLTDFLVQYFGPNPQVPAPKPVYVAPLITTPDGAVNGYADSIPTEKQKQRETPIIIRPGEETLRTKRHWSQLPSWVSRKVCFNYYVSMNDQVGANDKHPGCLAALGYMIVMALPNLFVWIVLCGIPGIAIGVGNLFEYLFYGMWVQFFGWIGRGLRNLNDNAKYRQEQQEQEYQKDLEKNRNFKKDPNRSIGKPLDLKEPNKK